MKKFELSADEKIIDTIKADYWENSFMFLYEQHEGEIVLTESQIIFCMKMINTKYVILEIKFEDISDINKCNVGMILPINPTGICITLKNGRKVKFSSMKRKKLMEKIQEMIEC